MTAGGAERTRSSVPATYLVLVLGAGAEEAEVGQCRQAYGQPAVP